MMKRKLLPRAVLAVILLALPAAADAPRSPPQYAPFDSDAVTIQDNFTHLEWDRRSILSGTGRNSTYDGATLLCGTLASLPSARLPSIKELLTILDEEPHDEYEFGMVVPKMIDALAFPDTPVDLPYWSSSPAGPGLFWTLSFRTGEMKAVAQSAAGKANVRCVR